ncbi:replication protein RepA4 [Klebsiella pneumoniae]|nr:replication protein RepA4 [Klebsiella pneumoniae]HBX5720171.1 replication protein RepA4 [Klebsiella pneumoniae]
MTVKTPLYAVGVDPARRQPQSGRISALAGRRAAYERVPDN